MEWSRVKSIMIGVFCFVNLFLLANYFSSMKTGISISEETIQNTVIILNNNNVNIKPTIIPRKMQDIKTFDVSNRFDTPKAAADYLWQVSQNQGLDYFNPEYVRVSGNSFEYISENKEIIADLDEDSAKAFAKKVISKLYLDEGLTIENTANQNSETYSFTFYEVFEGNKVLDSYITIEVNQTGITRIYGENWLFDNISGGGISSICPITEILINYAVSKQRIGSGSVEITDIQLGYFIGDRSGRKSTVTVVPVWRLTIDNGNNYYYDARNGDLLSENKAEVKI